MLYTLTSKPSALGDISLTSRAIHSESFHIEELSEIEWPRERYVCRIKQDLLLITDQTMWNKEGSRQTAYFDNFYSKTWANPHIHTFTTHLLLFWVVVFLAGFLAGAFLAGALLVAGFLAGAFLAGAFLVAGFLAGAFTCLAHLSLTFLVAGFLAAGFLIALVFDDLVADLLAAGLLVAVVLAEERLVRGVVWKECESCSRGRVTPSHLQIGVSILTHFIKF